MPPDAVPIPSRLVRQLLAQQHPDLAELPLRRVGHHGWDNAVFRLGADYSVRLPLRASAVPLVERERRWLPSLADLFDLDVPLPLRTGEPGCGYPWPWSVRHWVAGRTVGLRAVDPAPLIDFLAQLHRPAPDQAPHNPLRGVPLEQRDRLFRDDCAVLLSRGVETAKLADAWAALSAAPHHRGPPVWVHGDLHTANLVARAAAVNGVLDFGDLTAGDPACDLIAAWMLPERSRAMFREYAEGVDPAMWQRGRAWALAWGAAALRGAPAGSPIAALAMRTLQQTSTIGQK